MLGLGETLCCITAEQRSNNMVFYDHSKTPKLLNTGHKSQRVGLGGVYVRNIIQRIGSSPLQYFALRVHRIGEFRNNVINVVVAATVCCAVWKCIGRFRKRLDIAHVCYQYHGLTLRLKQLLSSCYTKMFEMLLESATDCADIEHATPQCNQFKLKVQNLFGVLRSCRLNMYVIDTVLACRFIPFQ